MEDFKKQSLDNIYEYLENSDRLFWGMLNGKLCGGFSRISMDNRSYFEIIILDNHQKRMFLDIYPQIICEKPFISMLRGYMGKRTAGYKSGKVDVESNGEVRIRIEASYADGAISSNTIDEMETLALLISDDFEKRADKISHGVFFSDDDFEVMGELERKFKERKKFEDDDEDDDLDDYDDEIEDDELDEGDNETNEDYDSARAKLMKVLESIVKKETVESDDIKDEDLEDDIDSDEIYEEETKVEIVLLDVGDNKLNVLSCIQNILDTDVATARNMMENTPCVLLTIDKKRAQEIVSKLQEAGAIVKIA